MKNLFHSKLFKRRLVKWIFMYCSVMVLLTMVVTYSRYMTSHAVGDSVRSAKFKIDIQNVLCSEMAPSIQKNMSCFDAKKDYTNEEGLRPSPKVTFYFKMNTSELEVSSKIVTFITLNDEQKVFSNYQLYDVTEVNSPVSVQLNNEEFPTLKFVQNVGLSDPVKEHTYMLVMDYDYNKAGYENDYIKENLISIGYSATQID